MEFLKGEIEAVPLPDDYADVVYQQLRHQPLHGEVFRVLKPGGRFAVSDVVFLGDKGDLPSEVVRSAGLWAGCVSGALEKSEYEALLEAAGFEDVSVEVTHTYPPETVAGSLGPESVEALRSVPVASAVVRARKPVE